MKFTEEWGSGGKRERTTRSLSNLKKENYRIIVPPIMHNTPDSFYLEILHQVFFFLKSCFK